MRLFSAYSLLLLLFSLIACQTSDEETVTPDTSTTQTDPCGDSNKTVKTAVGQAGFVRYNSTEKVYTIVVSASKTIGTQDIGVVCNLPDQLKVDGLAVNFSGEYKQYDKAPAGKVTGQTFYYLKISRLTSSKGNVQ